MKTHSKESEFIILNSMLNTMLIKKIDRQLNVHGISFTEYLIMHRLNGAPQKTMRRIDLAESVGLSASGVTRLIAPMEKIKLVEKEANPRDARVSLVKLSKPGEKLFDESTITFNETAKYLLEKLSPKQLEAITDLSVKLF
ncbi:MAG: MarR family transcriptional regulator [Melioribacteraceae bacterium]|nr:MarR family transcriptional regulator [Melioribacteraceae bacterium]MCF8263086.1 MarR family transcriptional regulator [Melioribacteraceae bacterium]MCF8431360.1 MarR family transcriptional regulator [Melioribacteraceae bacterium]